MSTILDKMGTAAIKCRRLIACVDEFVRITLKIDCVLKISGRETWSHTLS